MSRAQLTSIPEIWPHDLLDALGPRGCALNNREYGVQQLRVLLVIPGSRLLNCFTLGHPNGFSLERQHPNGMLHTLVKMTRELG
jgi:hypothetical protein